MKRFYYSARDKSGKKITGEVEAGNIDSAAKLVRDKGFVVVSMRPKRQGIFALFKSFRSRVTGKDVATFTRQFATMINAGLPVTESLSILRLQSRSSMQPVVSQLLADVEAGESLYNSFSRHKKIFKPTYLALIRAGEAGGVLVKVMERLADNLEKEQEFRGKVKGAMVYPVIIVGAMIVVSFIMVVFVMPRLLTIYTEFGTELPLPTKILIGITNFVSKLWSLIIIAVFVALWAFKQYRATHVGRRQIDALIFKIPLIGELQKQIILTELTRTLSLMVGTGVSIVEGLTITVEVSGNSLISDALEDCAKQVEKGFPIAFSFAQHADVFPYLLSQMVAIGEETGKMEEVLTKVSRVFEVESEQKVKALTTAIEPMIMIVLAIGVFFLVIAVILPIYNLTTQF